MESQHKFLKQKEEKLKKVKAEIEQMETGGDKGTKKQGKIDEKEWIERFTKKVEKKTYEDPNITFKPKISKKTEELLTKKREGAHKNTFDHLQEDSKKRIEKDKEKAH